MFFNASPLVFMGFNFLGIKKHADRHAFLGHYMFLPKFSANNPVLQLTYDIHNLSGHYDYLFRGTPL